MRILPLFAILVTFIPLAWLGCDAQQNGGAPVAQEIALEEFIRQPPGSFLILDVRSPEEYAAGHIKNALNIPHDRIAERISQIQKYAGVPVMLYCKSGRRAALAAEALSAAGFANLNHLTGDMDGWVAAGYPVTKDGP
jgi:phage shock protein E